MQKFLRGLKGLRDKSSILSVDWDFFCNPTQKERMCVFPDGGNENLPDTILNIIWSTYYHQESLGVKPPDTCRPLRQIPLKEDAYADLLDFFDNLNPKTPVIFTDSHAPLYSVIKAISKKVTLDNIDFHHDLYKVGTEVNCGNWASTLIQENKISKYRWFKDLDSSISHPPIDFKNIEFLEDLSLVFKNSYDFIFVCKSSTWSPPHLDEYFSSLISFVASRFDNIYVEDRAFLDRLSLDLYNFKTFTRGDSVG